MLSKRKKLVTVLFYMVSVALYVYLVNPFIRGGILTVLGDPAFRGGAKSVSLLSDWYMGFVWLLSLTVSAIVGLGIGYFLNRVLKESNNG